MRYTLERYVVRDYLWLILISFISLLMFFSLFYLADFARIVSDRGREFSLALKMTGYNLPVLAADVGPMTVILSLFILGTSLSRRGELVAMYASGISPLRLYVPIVAATALLALALYWSNDQLAPRWFAKVDTIKMAELGRWGSAERYFNRARHWYRVNNRLIRLSDTDAAQQSYYGVLILDIGAGHVSRKTFADKVVASNGAFVATGVTVENYGPGSELRLDQSAEKHLALPETFNAFLDLSSRPQKMTVGELGRVFKLRRRQGYNPSLYEVEYYSRIIGPLTLVCLVLVSLSFAFKPDIKRSLLQAGFECIAMVVVSFFLTLLFRALAMAQTVSAQIGAMGPALCLLAFALYRLVRSGAHKPLWQGVLARWS